MGASCKQHAIVWHTMHMARILAALTVSGTFIGSAAATPDGEAEWQTFAPALQPEATAAAACC